MGKRLNVRIICPFLGIFADLVDCVYLEERDCDDIEICPGNSDAWCTENIDENLSRNMDGERDREDEK